VSERELLLAARVAALEKELAQRSEDEALQEALFEIAALSSEDTPRQEHYERFHEIVGRLLDARNFIIATYDEEAGLIRKEYQVDENPGQKLESFPFGEGISSYVIRTREPLLLDPARLDALVAAGEIRAPRGATGFHSWMGVPLQAQYKVHGLIIVQSYHPEVIYTEANLELLRFFAAHVATIVARWSTNLALKRANEALVESADLLRTVGDIGRDLTGSLDVIAICKTLKRHFAERMPTDAFGVALLAPAGNELEYVYYIEDDVEDVGARFPLDHPTSLAAATLREDRELTLFNEDRLSAAPNSENIAPIAPIRSAVFRPLIASGRRIGVVTVQSHEADAYEDRHLELFRSATAYAAIALANAASYAAAEAARRQAAQALLERNQAEAHLVHSEKMAALGQLIAGVAHEINTPIGAIKSSGRNITESLGSSLLALPRLLDELDEAHRHLFGELVERASAPRAPLSTREERATVREVTTKLEALGFEHPRHRAGLLVQMQAHEDLDAVLPLLYHPAVDRVLETAHGIATITINADNINTAVDRVAKIIFALKSFSRFGGVQVWSEADLAESLETVLTIYQNQIKHGTELVRRFEDVPPVRCLPDELNQVWTNLVHNALQAMDHKGTLTVGLRREGDDVAVSIGDTGCGIPEEIRTRIFDAFFTTKPAGEGTGLGLDIVRKIIDKHQGRIDVDSEVGRGTTFTVRLPIAGVPAGAS